MHPTYNSQLVLLSIAVALFVSYTALTLASRVQLQRDMNNWAGSPNAVGARMRRSSRWWLIGGGVAMGVGIWSMHFIGMMAMSLPIELTYGVATTLLSLVIAIATSWLALTIVSVNTLTTSRLLIGGTFMGGGITAMHYVGMAAIRVAPDIAYDPWIVAASVAIAEIASLVALWLVFHLRDKTSWHGSLARLGAAVLMGLAIAGMHYTGMAAAHFSPHAHYLDAGVALDTPWLSALVALIAFGMLATTVAVAAVDSHRVAAAHAYADALRQVNAKVTEQASQLLHQATHDALTGLPNRVLLNERLAAMIVQAERSGSACAVMMLDLDRFKVINDSLGHVTGDALLKSVTARLTAALHASQTVARMGGDEFVVLLNDVTKAEATVIATNLVQALGAPYSIEGLEVRTSTSIGIALYPQDATTSELLLSRCDEAMYAAKQHGRNTFQFFALEMSERTQAKIVMENDLRQALEARQFMLHYQPKLDVRTGSILGAEALLRWPHPTKGMIRPDRFIPLAEEVGLIAPLGEWALREACQQARRWQDAGLPFLRMGVNLSTKQFHQANLLDVIGRALSDAGLAPHCLELEITESSVMGDVEQSVQILTQLSRMGVMISVDDFGTGHSSMSYLHQLPLDKLKLDRSFIAGLTNNENSLAIVKAIIGMAHTLKLKVTAEGVETKEQLALLNEFACDQYQGFLTSPAVPPAQFEALVRHQVAMDDLQQHQLTNSKLSAYRPAASGRRSA